MPTWSTPCEHRSSSSARATSRGADEHRPDLGQRARVGDGQPRPPGCAAGLPEHRHDRLQLALVGAVDAGPAARQPELGEELLGAPGVLLADGECRPRQYASQNSRVGGAEEAPAADETVPAVLAQHLRGRARS